MLQGKKLKNKKVGRGSKTKATTRERKQKLIKGYDKLGNNYEELLAKYIKAMKEIAKSYSRLLTSRHDTLSERVLTQQA